MARQKSFPNGGCRCMWATIGQRPSGLRRRQATPFPRELDRVRIELRRRLIHGC